MKLPVLPDTDNPKTGCANCEMLAYSARPEHEAFCETEGYGKDAHKIRAALLDPHSVKNPGVSDRPYARVDVLFVSTSPDAVEDRMNELFRGPGGLIMRTTVNEVFKGSGYTHAYTCLVRCRTPANAKPKVPAIRSCAPELWREIEARKPKVIVAVGSLALKVLGNVAGIVSLSGVVTVTSNPRVAETALIPCVDPGYLSHSGNNEDLNKFYESVRSARRHLDNATRSKGGYGTYRTLTTVRQVREYLASCGSRPFTACDTETRTLSAHHAKARLLCVSLCHSTGGGVTIPLAHRDSPFTGERLERVRDLLRGFFRDAAIRKVFQNGKFDAQQIRRDLGVWVEGIWGDTLYTHQLIEEQSKTHGLDRLAYQYTDMGGYDRPLELHKKTHPEADPSKGGNYANIPGDVLFLYAAQDADVTYRAFRKMRKWIKANLPPVALEAVHSMQPKLLMVLARMEYRGARVDVDRVREVQRVLTEKMDAAHERLLATPVVREFIAEQSARNPRFKFNPGSPAQVGKLMFEKLGHASDVLTDSGEKVIRARVARLTAKAKRNGTPFPSYASVIKEALVARKQYKLFSTSADVLHTLKGRKDKIAETLLQWKESKVSLSTFVSPMESRLDANLCVHGQFSPDGTRSGRLSSRSPNLQNIPSKDKGLVKSCYVTRHRGRRVVVRNVRKLIRRGILLQADYSQVELRVAAAYFNESAMIQAYLNDEDLHIATALDLFNLTREQYDKLDPKDAKLMRGQAKVINFLILYMGGPKAMMKGLKKSDIFFTEEQCKDLQERYFAVRPELKEGIDRLQDRVRRDGFLTVFTGFTRRVPDVFSINRSLVNKALRQIVNFPIQHIAAWMTLFALIIIDRKLRGGNFESRLIVTVHDSILIDAVEEELWEVSAMVKDVMENIATYSLEIMPSLDWSWLNVPIKAELEVGRSWGYAVAFDPAAKPKGPMWKPDENNDNKPKFLRSPATRKELHEAMRLIAA